MIDAEDLLRKDAYKNFSEEQKELLRDLLVKVEGKSGFEALTLLMEYSKKVPKDVKYTKEEEKAMLNAFVEILPEGERGSIENMVKMVEKFTGL